MAAVSVHTHAQTHTAHSHLMMDHILELGLLFRGERLIESRHRLGMAAQLLGRQISNGVGILVDAGRVIVFDGQHQVLMSGAHLVMDCLLVIHHLGKKSGGLLLLLRC